jgi:hypothetical protein
LEKEDERDGAVDAALVGAFAKCYAGSVDRLRFGMKILTFSHSPDDEKTGDHSNHTPNGLLPATDLFECISHPSVTSKPLVYTYDVKEETTNDSNDEAPTVQDDVDLELSRSVSDTSERQHRSEIDCVTLALRQDGKGIVKDRHTADDEVAQRLNEKTKRDDDDKPL